MINEKEKVSIFIDGSNLYHSLKGNNIKISFEDLIKLLETKRQIVDIFYYNAELEEKYNLLGYKKHMEFLEKISKIPNFHIVLCRLKRIILKDGSISFEMKGDDVCLAADLIKGSYENLYDVAIIVSGDEDFIPAIKIVQKNGKKVINAFFPKSSPNRLIDCCNNSINLKRLLS
jgi:uncharacterized LabA/DUF88 family protein